MTKAGRWKEVAAALYVENPAPLQKLYGEMLKDFEAAETARKKVLNAVCSLLKKSLFRSPLTGRDGRTAPASPASLAARAAETAWPATATAAAGYI